MLKYLIFLVVLVCLCSCSYKTTIEVPGDSIYGQRIGKDVDPTLIRAAFGGTLGYIFSEAMTVEDRIKVVNAYEYNPDNHTSKWINEQRNNDYTVTPQLTYISSTHDITCRDGEIVVIVNGSKTKAVSTGCRKDGIWYFK